LIPTLVYFLSVYFYGLPVGNIDMGGMWGSYIGLLFLGAAFVAIGVFASSVAGNQIVSFIIAVFLCMIAYLGFEFIYSLELFGKIDLFIRALGISAHYASLSRGVIDSRDVIYFLSFIGLFILLTKLSLESRKWEKKREDHGEINENGKQNFGTERCQATKHHSAPQRACDHCPDQCDLFFRFYPP